ncbi:MAG TPA: hypothetical protein VMZ92_15395 [Planctomycetota bacterium]|nr:hypothetical protein [Planctomycetota bacterium]
MKRRTMVMLFAVVLPVLVAVVGGCEPQRTLVPADKGLIGDVPVPTTFKFDPEHSSGYTSQDGRERYCNYHYKGRAFFTDVEAFYKRQMPVDGWRLQQDVSAGGRKTLYFRKGGIDPTATNVPTCVVTIFAKDEYATAIQIVRTER